MQERTDLHVAYMPQNYEEKMDGSKTRRIFRKKRVDKRGNQQDPHVSGQYEYMADEMTTVSPSFPAVRKQNCFS